MDSGPPHGCAIERLPQRGRLIAFNLDQNYRLIAFNLDSKLWTQGRPTDVRLNAFRNVGRLIGLCLLQNELCPLFLNRHVIKVPECFEQCCGMLLGTPDPLVRGTDPDPFIVKQK